MRRLNVAVLRVIYYEDYSMSTVLRCWEEATRFTYTSPQVIAFWSVRNRVVAKAAAGLHTWVHLMCIQVEWANGSNSDSSQWAIHTHRHTMCNVQRKCLMHDGGRGRCSPVGVSAWSKGGAFAVHMYCWNCIKFEVCQKEWTWARRALAKTLISTNFRMDDFLHLSNP